MTCPRQCVETGMCVCSLPKTTRSHISIDDTTGCWMWTAHCNRGGYGVAYRGKQQYKAHRLVYELLVGPITEPTLDHICHDPDECPGGEDCPHRRCVNPEHLRPASWRANILRSNSLQAINARKTHCPRGHEYDEENTRWYRGSRYCKTCQRAVAPMYKRLRRARKRLEAAS